MFILRFGAFSSNCNIVNSTTDSENAVVWTISSETSEVDGAMVTIRKSKNQKSRHVKKKKGHERPRRRRRDDGQQVCARRDRTTEYG